jgi:hypothetical protein
MAAFGRQNEATNNLIKEAQRIGPKDIFTLGAYGLNGVLRLILFPVNLILVPPFTFVLGILATITFGLLLMLLSLVWLVFFGIIMGSSWLWIKAPLARPLLFIPGVLIVLVSDVYVSLIPDMGEKHQKLIKLALCDSWPFSLLVYRLSSTVGQPEE